jgi:transketolase
MTAGSGHIGGNLSSLDALLVVFHEALRPGDRFVLSKGHSAGALYTALWSVGRLSDDDLKTFHRDATLLAGHPPARGIDILFATGSLGHGLSLAAGTALALRMKQSPGMCSASHPMGNGRKARPGRPWSSRATTGWRTSPCWWTTTGCRGSAPRDVASMSPLWEKLGGFDAEVAVIDGHDLEAIRGALLSARRRPG